MSTPTPETPAGGLTTDEMSSLVHVYEALDPDAFLLMETAVEKIVAERVAAAVVQARAEDRARIEAVREGPRHCGCAWCCASVRPEYRGEAHKRTCHPLTATEDGDQP